jgi:hypothetical protein
VHDGDPRIGVNGFRQLRCRSCASEQTERRKTPSLHARPDKGLATRAALLLWVQNIVGEIIMTMRTTVAAALAAFCLIAASGCAVTRGQETVGAYVDDAAITTAVKARYVESKDVDASSIRVETLNGTVMLSGFAKSENEKGMAESVARKVNGVKSVKNQLVVRN